MQTHWFNKIGPVMDALRALAGRVWIVVRFIVFGVVGFFVCMFSGLYAPENMESFFKLVPVAVAGCLMMLFGVGRWGQWGYLLAFGSMPFCLMVSPWLYHQLTGTAIASPLPFTVFVVMPFIVLVPVRRYYKNRDVQKDELVEHDNAA
jgi:peptidoglycan/LPS O-acetylase OafA/YrhL